MDQADEMGRRLRAARGYGRKSQPEIAEVLEVSEGTVKNIELGKRAPKRSELLAIAEACDVPMWFLEDGWQGSRGAIDDEGRRALVDLDREGKGSRAKDGG